MIKWFCNLWLKVKTNNYTRIPLFIVTLDYRKCCESGKPGSCTAYYLHPDLMEDEYLRIRLQECIDHIRDTHNLEALTKI